MAVAGAIVMSASYLSSPVDKLDFVLGAVLVGGGLLLRIEAAIIRGTSRQRGAPDDGAA
ncbi:hypothetical protein GCM10023176_16530 [Micromonospora coerulea]|uniref:Uncharacterized protein n=1 Tax=Micromonospora coerulea TaxID=47856 RepID=A0ABP8SC40_9ACTN